MTDQINSKSIIRPEELPYAEPETAVERVFRKFPHLVKQVGAYLIALLAFLFCAGLIATSQNELTLNSAWTLLSAIVGGAVSLLFGSQIDND